MMISPLNVALKGTTMRHLLCKVFVWVGVSWLQKSALAELQKKDL